jgi:hypothetical protein
VLGQLKGDIVNLETFMPVSLLKIGSSLQASLSCPRNDGSK